MSSRLQPQSGEAPSGERLRGKGRHGVKQKLMMTMTMMMAVAVTATRCTNANLLVSRGRHWIAIL